MAFRLPILKLLGLAIFLLVLCVYFLDNDSSINKGNYTAIATIYDKTSYIAISMQAVWVGRHACIIAVHACIHAVAGGGRYRKAEGFKTGGTKHSIGQAGI